MSNFLPKRLAEIKKDSRFPTVIDIMSVVEKIEERLNKAIKDKQDIIWLANSTIAWLYDQMSTPIKATFDKPEHVIIPNQIMVYDDKLQKFILVDKPINLKVE
jgi:hypothetical protein